MQPPVTADSGPNCAAAEKPCGRLKRLFSIGFQTIF